MISEFCERGFQLTFVKRENLHRVFKLIQNRKKGLRKKSDIKFAVKKVA